MGFRLLPTAHRNFQIQIVLANDFRSVPALQTTHNEVPASHVLEIINKDGIDQRSAQGADDGKNLCRCFLGDVYRVAFCDQRDQADNSWRRSFSKSILGEM